MCPPIAGAGPPDSKLLKVVKVEFTIRYKTNVHVTRIARPKVNKRVGSRGSLGGTQCLGEVFK